MTPSLSDLVVEGHKAMTLVVPDDGQSASVGDVADVGVSYIAGSAGSDSVGVLMTNDRSTVEVILGAVLAGSHLVSLPLPGRGADPAVYASFIRSACECLGLNEVVVANQYADLLASTGLAVRRHSELSRRPLAAPSSDGFALTQFTSGSTGPPRPIRVSDRQLGANVSAILDTVRPVPGDAVVSWLPLAHDMGLIGMLFTGLAAGGPKWTGGGDIVLLEPTTFLRKPVYWLEAMGQWRASFTASPDFGYRHVLRRPVSGRLDLSSLRCAIVGGEIVRADTLRTFSAALAHHGLAPRALCPAYGMAEAGLAVTMTLPEEDWRERHVSMQALTDSRGAVPMSRGTAMVLVSSGSPLRGYEVDTGASTHIGRIRVKGPSLASDGETGGPLADATGWYQTGDIGFVEDGRLYACGRTDDYVLARGRNIYAPAIEVAVSAIPGVRAGRVAAVNRPSGDWAIVTELTAGATCSAPEQQALRREIVRAAIGVCAVRPDEIVFVAAGSLPLTSSGKLQRHHIIGSLATGELSPV